VAGGGVAFRAVIHGGRNEDGRAVLPWWETGDHLPDLRDSHLFVSADTRSARSRERILAPSPQAANDAGGTAQVTPGSKYPERAIKTTQQADSIFGTHARATVPMTTGYDMFSYFALFSPRLLGWVCKYGYFSLVSVPACMRLTFGDCSAFWMATDGTWDGFGKGIGNQTDGMLRFEAFDSSRQGVWDPFLGICWHDMVWFAFSGWTRDTG
jgi:hypothetical protein